MLKARTSNLKKNSVTVKWDKVKNADGYILYGNKCGKKNTFKHIKTFTKNSTVKYTQKKLKKGTYYKYLVVAYKNINGVKVTIAASKNVHATTKGGRFGVAKSVKVNKTSKTLAVKKKFKIKASEVKLDKKIKHHRNIKFESDNSRVATVNSKGVVTAKQKGRCYIYVYAQNGVYKRIRITVK
ncbi:MAG: fibronectin type III domain-containing protein, partial [Lachnospiraceae bacterium]|nr:fibronectin type III domain-containing protein [Lachnospiraceae bacterium]